MTPVPAPAAVADRPRAVAPATRLAWLDAIRGIAALVVVVHHFGLLKPLPGGAWITDHVNLGILGVMLFFLVSGYIIPASLERRGDVRRFWVGRIFRIYPLVLVLMAAAWLMPAGYTALNKTVGANPGWGVLSNLTLLHDFTGVPSALNVMWSLAYEMLFYFLVVALFVTGQHRRSAPIALSLAAAALIGGGWWQSKLLTPQSLNSGPGPVHALTAVAAIGVSVGLIFVFAGRTRTGAIILAVTGSGLMLANGRAPFFESMLILATMFAGTAVYRAERREIPRRAAVLVCSVIPIAGTLAAFFFNNGSRAQQTWENDWRAFASAWLIAWLAFGVAMALRSRRWPRPLVWLGQVSYSVYLVHFLVLWAAFWFKDTVLHLPQDDTTRTLVLVAALALTLGVAQVTYRLIELPGQRVGRWIAGRLPEAQANRSAYAG